MKESDTYYIFERDDWKALDIAETSDTISLTDEELEALRSLNDSISLDDVKEVYFPIIQLLSLFIHSYQQEQKALMKAFKQEVSHTPYIIGVSGSVAVGKSTVARLLQSMLSQAYKDKKVQLITTDGFLYPNEKLEEMGLMDRKGFPESYDMGLLIDFLSDVKNRKPNIRVPYYSHQLYNIVPGKYVTIDQPDILIVEGINVLQLPASQRLFVSDFFDFSFYIDAEPDNIEKWYLQRFGILLDTAMQNPNDFYHDYAKGNRQEAFAMARNVWKTINLKNLEEYILPTRFRADMILHKTTNHYIDSILMKKF